MFTIINSIARVRTLREGNGFENKPNIEATSLSKQPKGVDKAAQDALLAGMQKAAEAGEQAKTEQKLAQEEAQRYLAVAFSDSTITESSNSSSTTTSAITLPEVNGTELGPLETQSKPKIHTIARGETLSRIADVYGTTVKALQVLNKIDNPNNIVAGHSIKIPGIVENTDALAVAPVRRPTISSRRAESAPRVVESSPRTITPDVASTTSEKIPTIANLEQEVRQIETVLKELSAKLIDPRTSNAERQILSNAIQYNTNRLKPLTTQLAELKRSEAETTRLARNAGDNRARLAQAEAGIASVSEGQIKLNNINLGHKGATDVLAQFQKTIKDATTAYNVALNKNGAPSNPDYRKVLDERTAAKDRWTSSKKAFEEMSPKIEAVIAQYDRAITEQKYLNTNPGIQEQYRQAKINLINTSVTRAETQLASIKQSDQYLALTGAIPKLA